MTTSIESIGSIGLNSILKGEEESPSSASQLGMFGSIFQDAIQNVKDTDAELVQAEYLLSTGQLDNPATVTIAATKNELAVDLLVQLRSKALDAYSQLTQISL
jgi:flagellar hook-basal body complex protein FliE